jgi:hypothetical protein
MNSSTRFIPVLFVFTGLISMSSCYKIYDFVKQHPGSEVDACRIRTLYTGSDSIQVYYNANGDPTDMLDYKLGASSAWQGNKHFKYDKNHRISDYYWANPGTNYRLIWHRYSYPKKSIVTDSLFAYIVDGSGPNPPPQNFNGLSIDSLDTKGRIVKITYPNGSNPVIQHFSYNAAGNLDLPNAHYDNKLNMYHTNTVWMFLQNDYSVNNRLDKEGAGFQVTGYNEAGLPLGFKVIAGNHGTDLFFIVISQQLLITYDCN